MDDFKDVFQFNLKIKDFQLAIFDRKTSYPILNPCKATSKYCCAPSTVSPENIQYQVREFFRLQLISKTLLKCVRPHLHNFLGPPLCLRIIGISSFPVTNCDFLFLSPRKSRFFTLPEIDIAPEKWSSEDGGFPFRIPQPASCSFFQGDVLPTFIDLAIRKATIEGYPVLNHLFFECPLNHLIFELRPWSWLKHFHGFHIHWPFEYASFPARIYFFQTSVT